MFFNENDYNGANPRDGGHPLNVQFENTSSALPSTNIPAPWAELAKLKLT